MPNLTEVLKKAAMEAVAAGSPTGILFGTVETVTPLSVRIDQKTILTSEFLLQTSNVRPHTVSVTASGYTEYTEGGNGEEAFARHRHSVTGTNEYTVNNVLEVGDRVLLLSQQGGQLYVILDRLEAET